MIYSIELFQDINEKFIYFDQMFKMLKENMSYITEVSNDDKNIWIENIITPKDLFLICISVDNKLIGFLEYSIDDNYIYLCEIQIDKTNQGDGKTFKMLINRFLEEVKQLKINKIVCRINPKNDKSKKVFKHLGFESIGNNRYTTTYDRLIQIR